jgi:hypothetical protein
MRVVAGIYPLVCNNCWDTKQVRTDRDLPDEWSFMYKDIYGRFQSIFYSPQWEECDPDNLFCSVKCYNEFHKDDVVDD